MQEYRAYLMGPDGHVTHRIDLICADENAAKERAKHMCPLWRNAAYFYLFPARRALPNLPYVGYA